MKELNTLYTPAQVAERIDLSQSSVRRYTIALEKAGYANIKRDPNNHRKYDIYDIQTLEYFKGLVNDKKHSFEQALEETMSDLDYIHAKVDTRALSTLSSDNKHTERLEQKVDTLIELVRELNQKTEHLQKDNERLTELVEKQPLMLDISQQESTDAVETPKDEDREQTEDDEGNTPKVSEIPQQGTAETSETKKEEINQKNDGIFSRLRKFFR
ncbi:helix-turn-helix domain-containing protein [Salinicoccus carnicancri]|uniref:helix-turn-helix domain-containing protein n=1 Tax=Salinicoccus carnicancri TaxID=558170 RepID=UPI0002EE61C5|nr:MerR family transcriptional regulator [Salinicoccus carnicancri]